MVHDCCCCHHSSPATHVHTRTRTRARRLTIKGQSAPRLILIATCRPLKRSLAGGGGGGGKLVGVRWWRWWWRWFCHDSNWCMHNTCTGMMPHTHSVFSLAHHETLLQKNLFPQLAGVPIGCRGYHHFRYAHWSAPSFWLVESVSVYSIDSVIQLCNTCTWRKSYDGINVDIWYGGVKRK